MHVLHVLVYVLFYVWSVLILAVNAIKQVYIMIGILSKQG